MVTKEILTQYSDLLKEKEEVRNKIAYLEDRIPKLEEKIKKIEDGEVVKDKVRGGLGGIQSFTVEGVPTDEYQKKRTELLSKKLMLNQRKSILEILEFEITENELFDDIETYNRIINDIHSIGAKVSMDDFGSGNTSLNILTKYDFDFIKLDKSFFKEKSFDESTKKSLKTIVTLAHELGKKVVAEGVETEVIDKFLKSINCDIVQGFYYSKPMSFDEYIKYIKKGN